MDGGFSEWSRYGECSEECGGGKKESTRTCTNPIPAHGGRGCVGELIRTEECNTHECPGKLFEIKNKKWSFPLRISSVNVTKSAGT